VRRFPTNLPAKLFDFETKPNFTVANEAAIAAPPTVDFGTRNPPPAETTVAEPAPAQ
jgi:LemA protein